jgi:hypothetical protein
MPEGVVSSALLEARPGPLTSDEVTTTVGGRRVTLEERLEAAWRSARRDGGTECPVCDAAMRADGAAARCGGCGSVLC